MMPRDPGTGRSGGPILDDRGHAADLTDRSPFRATGAALIGLALVAGACGPQGAPAAAATCPDTSIRIVRPAAALPLKPVVYAFLVDRAFAGDARRTASYPWPQLPNTALRTVTELLPKLELRPGDAVFASWISHNSNDTREIFLPLAQVATPAAATVPPLPAEPTPPINKLDCNRFAADAAKYESESRAWQDRNQAQLNAYAAAERAAVASFIDTVSAKVKAAAVTPDPTGTDIYGGLFAASNVLRSQSEIRKLVVFSDLTDTVASKARADLDKVDVIVALYHRDDPNDQGQGQRTWDATLRGLGSRAPVFVSWAATNADRLAQLLKEGSR